MAQKNPGASGLIEMFIPIPRCKIHYFLNVGWLVGIETSFCASKARAFPLGHEHSQNLGK
jgi:hypothetical protein